MATGVGVSDECVSAFLDLKLKRKYTYVLYKMSDDMKTIVVEKAVEKSTYDEFLAALPPNDPRYVVYDFVYNVGDEGERHKILFYVWAPDTAKVRQKMVYAGSKDSLRKKLDGVALEIQGTDMSEVAYESVLERVAGKQTKE